jgi:hypothetical protein
MLDRTISKWSISISPNGGNMALKIESTKDVISNGIKIIVYGAAGVGKTRLSATTGDLENTLILSAEAGLLSLQEFDIDVSVVRSIDDMREAVKFVRSEESKYTWVIIDSLSEIAEVCLDKEKAENKSALQAYGKMGDTMIKLVKAFRDSPGINIVLIVKEGADDDEGRLLHKPSLPGKRLSADIPYLFDEVFAMRTERDGDGGVKRFLQTINDGHYDAKDRSGRLDPIEKASLKNIAAKINKVVEPKNKRTKKESSDKPEKLIEDPTVSE